MPVEGLSLFNINYSSAMCLYGPAVCVTPFSARIKVVLSAIFSLQRVHCKIFLWKVKGSSLRCDIKKIIYWGMSPSPVFSCWGDNLRVLPLRQFFMDASHII